MFAIPYILFLVISMVVGIGTILLLRLVKVQQKKDRILKTFAVLTFCIHISIMWVDFFTTGKGTAYDNILLPIYFCNFIMYLLLICAFIPNKNTRFFKIFATFVAYAGVLGSLITFFLTPFQLGQGYDHYKSLVSHFVMLLGSIYLFTGGYVKVSVYNIIPYFFGLGACGVVGVLVNFSVALAKLPPVNAMYLLHAPNEAPMLSAYIIALMMIGVIFVFTVLYEQIFYESDRRWYKNLSCLKECFSSKAENVS